MSQGISKSAGPKRRRRFTKRFYTAAVAHYRTNGWQATAKRFRISGTIMQRVKALSAGKEPNGLERLEKWAETRTPSENRTGRSLYLAAKALERALMEHRRAGSPPSDVEHYAFFLLKEILK